MTTLEQRGAQFTASVIGCLGMVLGAWMRESIGFSGVVCVAIVATLIECVRVVVVIYRSTE